MLDNGLKFGLEVSDVRFHLEEVSVVVRVFDGVEGIGFGDDVIDFVFEDFEVRVFVETNVVDDLLGLEDGDGVFEHVVLVNENVGTGESSGHLLLHFVEFLDPLLGNGQLVFGPCQM